MAKLDIYPPSQVFSGEPPDFSSPAYRFLAEGDSWFSIGSLNPLQSSNLLFEMVFEKSGMAINCASPGDTLKRMAQMNTDPNFIDLLCGRRARFWDAILLSCGGNDLIEAVRSPASDAQGQPVPQALRLLRTRNEWGLESEGALRYLSQPALPDSTGVSGDWANEIHLTRAGCRKVAVPWAAAIEAALQH